MSQYFQFLSANYTNIMVHVRFDMSLNKNLQMNRDIKTQLWKAYTVKIVYGQ